MNTSACTVHINTLKCMINRINNNNNSSSSKMQIIWAWQTKSHSNSKVKSFSNSVQYVIHIHVTQKICESDILFDFISSLIWILSNEGEKLYTTSFLEPPPTNCLSAAVEAAAVAAEIGRSSQSADLPWQCNKSVGKA